MQSNVTKLTFSRHIYAVESYRHALIRLKETAEDLGKSIGLPADYWDQGAILTLGNYVKTLTVAEALDGAPLLCENPESLLQAMMGLERLVIEAIGLRQRLSSNYDLSVLNSNLVELQTEWTAATSANIFVRNARKEKVRIRRKLFCDSLADDIYSDIILLQNLAALASKIPEYKKILGGCQFWSRLNTDISKFPAIRDWMEKILIYITKMASHTRLDISDIRAHTLKILTDHGYIFSDNGPVKSAFINYRTSLAEFITAVERLSVLAGLDHKDFLPNGPNWIENNLQTTSRWLAGVADAPAWCQWRSAVVEADNIGLTPLIGAIDDGKVTDARRVSTS